jgi:hypothetical protein
VVKGVKTSLGVEIRSKSVVLLMVFKWFDSYW